jgi:hypothetical protein
MIIFQAVQKEKLSSAEFKKMDSADIMDDDRDFEIIVNGKLFYQDEYFPILEFCRYSCNWLKKRNTDFAYNTVETEENPHLAFKRVENGYMIYSVWQKFECRDIFSFEEIIEFVQSVVDYVIDGYDYSVNNVKDKHRLFRKLFGK